MATANGVNGSAGKTSLALLDESSLVDQVGQKVNEWLTQGQIVLPKDYSVDNAMKFAYLELQTVKDLNNKPLFVDGKLDETVGTRNSLINALLTMAVQGLSVGKDQGYFIIYAKQVTFMRSYFGTETVTMMVQPKIGSFASAVIREGDTIAYDLKYGKIVNLEHKTTWEGRNKPITGAYAVAFDTNGAVFAVDIMSTDEIHASWRQSKNPPFDNNGALKPGSMHVKFPVEFCKRTVLSRLCKPIINTSTDKQLLLDMVKKSEDLYDQSLVREEVEEKANKGPVIEITAEAGEVVDNGQEAAEDVKPFDSFKARFEAAKDLAELNQVRKDLLDGVSLTEDEKKDLSNIYRAEATRIKRPSGSGPVTTGGEELGQTPEQTQARTPGF